MNTKATIKFLVELYYIHFYAALFREDFSWFLRAPSNPRTLRWKYS